MKAMCVRLTAGSRGSAEVEAAVSAVLTRTSTATIPSWLAPRDPVELITVLSRMEGSRTAQTEGRADDAVLLDHASLHGFAVSLPAGLEQTPVNITRGDRKRFLARGVGSGTEIE